MSKPDTQSQIDLLTAQVASAQIRITALTRLIAKLLPKQDPEFLLQLKVELLDARNDMFSTLTKIDPPAAKLFLELTNLKE